MKDDQLFKQIERFYGEQRPSPETVAFLLELARRKGSPGIRPTLRMWVWAVGMAAALAAGAIGYRIGVEAKPSANSATVADARGKNNQKTSDENIVVAQPDSKKTSIAAPNIKTVAQNEQAGATKIERSTPEREKMRGKPVVATIPPIEGEDLPHPATPPTPRLMLARIYAEWCPRSPRLIPVYELLAQDYANEPIMIVTFDVTDPGKRRQSGYMAQSLGVLGLLGHKWEPSTILLIDRETCEILETIREVDEQPRMEQALTLALHQ